MIQRTLFSELKTHLDKPEISILIGPRQAGKTTLMRLLEDDLKRQGKRTVFFNLDIEHDKNFFRSQNLFLQKLHLELGKNPAYVFIDEIQRKEDSGLFLKGMYDMKLPYKLIVSGSGSLELKEKIHESLTGRKRLFEITTLSFLEFLNYRTDYRYQKQFAQFLDLEKEKVDLLLAEYLRFGGYPRLVLENQASEKQKIIAEIYQSYLEKDIAYLLGVEKSEAFTNLVKILASQIGQMVNLSELSATTGLAISTVKQYLWYLQKTFVVEKNTPFFKNIRKEITKSPIIYFYDLGLRNYAIGKFTDFSDEGDGFLFQNFVFNILKNQIVDTPATLHFWRTKDQAEVDIIIDQKSQIIPVEIKNSRLKKDFVPASLKSFIKKYQPKQAWIINLSYESRLRIDKTEIKILPFYKLLALKNDNSFLEPSRSLTISFNA